MGEKLGLYAAMGGPEYYVFDPSGQYLRPSFRAFRLQDDVYRELPAVGGIESPRLGLRLVVDGDRLRLATPEGDLLPEEVVGLARSADELRRCLQAERARARELEAELQRLRARLGEATD